jgi:PAS domain S-box-containing protein
MANPLFPSSAPFRNPDLLSAIALATDDVIFAKDMEGRYQFANPATLAAFGRDAADVLGHTDEEILQDKVAARRRMQTDRQVLASGETVEGEEPLPRADGTLQVLLVRKMPLRDAQGVVIGTLGIARDITARKQVEMRAESDRLKLQMAIQAAGLVTAEIDYRTNQNHISAELARLIELGDEAMVVPRQAIFDRIHPEDRERYLQGVARAVDPNGSGHLAIDVRALMPSGTVKWMHIVLQVTFSMLDGRMQPDRGICAAADITAQTLAVREVVESDRRKDEFIATLAHELRNPLAPIRNGLEILKRTAQLPPPAARVRDMMDRQLAHLVRLVDDLLDVSRITRDKLEMRMRPLALQEILDDAIDASRPNIEAAGHKLVVQLPPQPVRLEGDLTRLAQVVSNLLNNAAKYTPGGGTVELAARAEESQVVIEVHDNGAGIAADMLPHVFDLFAQVDRTRQQAQGGLGIGLWLVKKLVELHHGSIEARSEGLGHGSTFTLRLPLR